MLIKFCTKAGLRFLKISLEWILIFSCTKFVDVMEIFSEMYETCTLYKG